MLVAKTLEEKFAKHHILKFLTNGGYWGSDGNRYAPIIQALYIITVITLCSLLQLHSFQKMCFKGVDTNKQADSIPKVYVSSGSQRDTTDAQANLSTWNPAPGEY